MNRPVSCILSACVLLFSSASRSAEPPPLFSEDSVTSIDIQIDPAGIKALRQQPREYVRGKIRRGTNLLAAAEIRLKGNFSFQPIDQKPGFSLKLSPAAQNQFSGHKRLLLNNSAQDPSYLRNKLASDMFLQAGLPTARVNFATVTLNGRALNLYLLLEGTDEKFLQMHFGSADGNLYEGADQDISAPLEIDFTPRGTDRSDLQSLVNTCSIDNLQSRWTKMSRLLDINQFATFMAMELLVAHKDGYCMDLNNYRLYHNAKTGKFIFIAHGMDFILDNPVLQQDRHWKGIVARAFIDTPKGKSLFHDQVNQLGAKFYGDPQFLARRVDALWKMIEPALTDTAEKDHVHNAIRELQSTLRSRAASFPQYLQRSQRNNPPIH